MFRSVGCRCSMINIIRTRQQVLQIRRNYFLNKLQYYGKVKWDKYGIVDICRSLLRGWNIYTC